MFALTGSLGQVHTVNKLFLKFLHAGAIFFYSLSSHSSKTLLSLVRFLTLLGLGLIKINDVSANFNNPRPSLILNN